MSTTGVSSSTLAGVPLLAGADAEALEALAADAYPRRVLAGEWLIREGDDAEDLYVVLRGRLRAVAGVDADRRTLRVLGPGAAIGELALLTGSVRSASVQAVRDSTLLQLGRGRFVELMERDPRFAAAVARELAAQLQASGGLAAPPTRPALIALRRLDPGVPLEAVASSLARALSAYGPVEVLEADAAGTSAVERAEDENAHVLLVDEAGAGVWSDLCARQADRTLLVATADSPPPAEASPDADLVVLGPSSGGALRALLDAVQPRAHHRLASTEPSDPGAGATRAATRRACARGRPLRRRRARLRSHRSARRARGRRDRGRPLRRLLDGLVHRGDGRRRLERAATSATAATRSSCGTRRSTTTRSHGSR